MKRTALGVLCLAVALPLFAGNAGDKKATATKARCVSLAHTREGWRMDIRCHEGEGAIVRIDSGTTVQYRGTGIFAAASQQDLDAMYQSLVPSDEAPIVLMQLG